MAVRAFPVTQPTGLKRSQAAIHCGVSPSHFDKMVTDGLLPHARQLGGVKVWLRQELDEGLFALSSVGGVEGENSCDLLFG